MSFTSITSTTRTLEIILFASHSYVVGEYNFLSIWYRLWLTSSLFARKYWKSHHPFEPSKLVLLCRELAVCTHSQALFPQLSYHNFRDGSARKICPLSFIAFRLSVDCCPIFSHRTYFFSFVHLYFLCFTKLGIATFASSSDNFFFFTYPSQRR